MQSGLLLDYRPAVCNRPTGEILTFQKKVLYDLFSLDGRFLPFLQAR
jgi:hypothetical protein